MEATYPLCHKDPAKGRKCSLLWVPWSGSLWQNDNSGPSGVRAQLFLKYQRTSTVSIAGIRPGVAGTDHRVGDLLRGVVGLSALLGGHGHHCRLLQSQFSSAQFRDQD